MKPSRDELKEILKLHKMWLNKETGSNYANLTDVNLAGIDLRYADLRYATLTGVNLEGANLGYINLEGANLSYANLINVNLRGANLKGTNLKGTNLKGTDLRGVDLRNTNLRYCIGNNKEVKSLQIGTYLISYNEDILNIGCQSHKLDAWKTFTDNEILEMDDISALDWWKLNKEIIISLVERELKG